MCSRYFLKMLNFFLTIFCCVLIMALVIALVGCVMMGLYSIGSLLLTGHINSIMAFYVSADTAFILGGGLAVIAALLCHSEIYNYFDRCTCCYGNDGPLNRIPNDTTKHSSFAIKANHLLQDNEEFQCPICKDSMLTQTKPSIELQPVTLRYIEEKQNNSAQRDRSHDEATYHKGCISDWIDSGGQREPVLGVDLFQSESGQLVRYNGYNKRQRNLWRKIEESQTTDSNVAQSNIQC